MIVKTNVKTTMFNFKKRSAPRRLHHAIDRHTNPADIYFFKISNGNIRMREICSQYTVMTPERRQCLYC